MKSESRPIMQEHWIYLDYNASTPMDPEVVEVMRQCLAFQGHPSSAHPHGRQAAAAVEHSRELVATALGCEASEIIFCSGSTEASNQVIKGVAFHPEQQGRTLHFIYSEVDHAATTAPLNFLKRLGHEVTFLPVDTTGRIDPQRLKEEIKENTILVTLIHGQNEVGTVQPLEEIGEICRESQVLFHVDASQSFGKVPFTVDSLKADFLNIAGHKIYGPKGVGALYVRQGRELEPLLHGGGHEAGLRSGTPAPQLIAGLGEACRLVTKLGSLSGQATEALWQALSQHLGDRVRRNGHPDYHLPNVLHVTFQGVNGRELLNLAHVSASTGAACHSAAVSPVLKAMGFSAEEAAGSVRLSCGRYTSVEDAQSAAKSLQQAFESLSREAAAK